jgi:hypothetical protein
MDYAPRVYVLWTEELWAGVRWAVKQRTLNHADQYVTLSVAPGSEVCIVLPDGRRMCDLGTDHVHD